MSGFHGEVISDTHLNLGKYTTDQISAIFPGSASTLVLAGDIGDPDEVSLYTALNIARRRYKRILYIPGNHEFYVKESGSKKTPASVLDWFQKLDDQWDNFHFFYRRNEVIDGVRILGATGWTTSPKMTKWATTISDEGKKDISFLEQGLLHSKEPVLAITHYPSTMRVIDTNFKDKITRFDYAQDLERLYYPPLHTWIFGHIHQTHDFQIPYNSWMGNSNIRILCNPYGYRGEVASYLPKPFTVNSIKVSAKFHDDTSYRTL